jgi:hypothetical protein
MKRLTKLLGITVIGMVIAIGLAGCPADTDGGGGGGDANLFAGSWTTSTINGTVTLTFRTDLIFTQSGGGVILNGTYSYSGDIATITATYQGVSEKTTAVISSNGSLVFMGNVFTKTDGTNNPGGISVVFVRVTANGSSAQTTTQLTLTFSGPIPGLSASDIILSGVSGVQKGSLAYDDTGSYYLCTLPISGFTVGGTLAVAVAKTGYHISGSPQTVTIYYYSYSGGGPLSKPAKLASNATRDQALAKLDAIINYSGTPWDVELSAEAYRDTVNSSTANSNWNLMGPSLIIGINSLIDCIP